MSNDEIYIWKIMGQRLIDSAEKPFLPSDKLLEDLQEYLNDVMRREEWIYYREEYLKNRPHEDSDLVRDLLKEDVKKTYLWKEFLSEGIVETIRKTDETKRGLVYKEAAAIIWNPELLREYSDARLHLV